MNNSFYSFVSGKYDSITHDGDTANAVYFAKLTSKYNSESVLDLGCGTGEFLSFLENSFDCYGIDSSKKMLGIASKKLKKSLLSAQDLINFSLNKKFDAITCFNVIEEILPSQINGFFSTAFNSLNKKGFFLLSLALLPFYGKEEFFWGKDFGKEAVLWKETLTDNKIFTEITKFTKTRKGLFSKKTRVLKRHLYLPLEIRKFLKKAGFRKIRIYSEHTFRNMNKNDEIVNIVAER
ncbi:MAG: class I SAM-dependent methyltransferase [Candidatus Diapherotrites archaeon]